MNVPKIKDLREVAVVTGKDYTGKWNVYGTDLGVAVYAPSQKRMYFLFGDTIGEWEVDKTKPKKWRGCVAGYTENLDFSEGIKWDGFLDDEEGNARELVISHHCSFPHYEVSKITQGGIEIDGNLYFFYESIHHWGPAGSGLWYLNYGGVIKSTDGGKTFEKVHDLTWVEPTHDPQLRDNAARIAAEDLYGNPTGIEFDAKLHAAPGFGQTFATDGKDGYIYIYGRLGGRATGIKCGRVKKEDFERFDAYEYITGFDEDGNVIWKPYREGLDEIIKNPVDAEIVKGPTSNMSVQYNEYLGKWLLTFYRQRTGIFYCVSDTPYGPYTEPTLAIDFFDARLRREIEESKQHGNCLYGGFTHEMMNREGGKIVPIVISQWYGRTDPENPDIKRFYGSRLYEIEFE